MLRPTTLSLVLLVIIAVFAFSVVSGHRHKCSHDAIAKEQALKTYTSLSVKYDNHPWSSNKPLEDASAVFAPIRIFTDFTYVSNPSDPKSIFLTQKLIPAAVKWLTSVLSVVPVTDRLRVSRFCQSVWTSGPNAGKCAVYASSPSCGNFAVPSNLVNPDVVCTSGSSTTSCTTLTGGTGVYADYILFVATGNTDPGVLAYASQCTRDKFDRPIAGYAVFGPSLTDDPVQFEDQISTAIHEIMHALGFSAASFPFFRDANGNPRTPREANGMPKIVNGAYEVSTSTVRSVQLPTRFKTASFLVTPAVVREVQNHFGCTSIPGAELEDEGGSGTAGSHLEQRIFFNEVMCGTSNFNSAYSRISLAVFEDSGWYQVNYNNAQTLTWGKGQGCRFVDNMCSSLTDLKTSFCTSSDASVSKKTCTVDGSAVGYCNIFTPADSCYVYRRFSISGTTQNSDCRYVANTPSGTNYRGQTFGPTSRCFESTLLLDGFSGSVPAAACYKYSCTATAVVVTLPGGTSVSCTSSEAGLAKKVTGYSGTIVCPSFSSVCGGCPNNCNGHGTCVNGVCKCSPGYTDSSSCSSGPGV